MINLVLILVLKTGLALTFPSIEGKWEFTSYLYNGTELPKPNPDLTILFEFQNGISRLYWTRANEVGFCERKAQYQYTDQHIYEMIVWVNPHNRFDCGQDPDMQLGRNSKTEYRFVNDQLQTRVLVGDLDVWYVWTKQIDPDIHGFR
jgi:hypothetical protein